jgi:hypothetical protein
MTLGASYGPSQPPRPAAAVFLLAPGPIIRDGGPKQRTFEFAGRLTRLVGFSLSANFGQSARGLEMIENAAPQIGSPTKRRA